MGFSDKIVDVLAHIPFLLVTYDGGEGKPHKVGFNFTRLVELVIAIAVIVYMLSRQLDLVSNKLELISQKAELERVQTAEIMNEMSDRLRLVEERVYNHAISSEGTYKKWKAIP